MNNRANFNQYLGQQFEEIIFYFYQKEDYPDLGSVMET